MTLRFGHRGWKLDDSFLFYDFSTDSLWCQAIGTAVLGPMKGAKLKRFPVTHTTWGEWKTLHPETRVLAKPLALVGRYRKDSYAGYYARNRVTFGLAICRNTIQKLYPLAELEETPVVNDELEDLSVLVVFHRPTATAVAYNRSLHGTKRRFEPVETTATDIVLRDVTNGSLWSGLKGNRLDNAEEKLRPLIVTQFAISKWSEHYPKGLVYQAKGAGPQEPADDR